MEDGITVRARTGERAPGVIPARWWHPLGDGRVRCDLCPRGCRLRPGQRGFCFVRRCVAGEGGGAPEMVFDSYGRTSGFCVDPIEKKPLNHFYPGTTVLSFGTLGCNLGCRFCQNWDLSRAHRDDRSIESASPDEVAALALDAGCRSVAFTYNEPVVFAEYAIDCAHAARARGLKTVAVTAGYIEPAPHREFFAAMDAANVDLKSFNDAFYRRFCAARLAPVLDTLRRLRDDAGVWFEVTTLLIPGENDSADEVTRLATWLAENAGAHVPLHLTAFHPAHRMLDRHATPQADLARARALALRAGLHHVYTGNIDDARTQSTWCAGCSALLIARRGYHVGAWHLDKDARCRSCGAPLPGRFDSRGPGNTNARGHGLPEGDEP